MCPFGRTLSYCYNQCPLVCGMMAEDCNAMCLSGCFCSADLYQFGDLCLQEESCPDIDIDFEDIPVRDKCSDFEDCDECISSDPDCQWCPYEPGDNSVVGSRCRLREGNPLCPVEVQDPKPTIEAVQDLEFGDTVQIKPQQFRLQLRKGQPKEFEVQFRAAQNYPLDVYFLLDVTGSFSLDFRRTVTPLVPRLVEALSNISTQYAVAFGGFADKRAIPYAFPNQDPDTYVVDSAGTIRCTVTNVGVEDCNPTISFRHTTNFSSFDGDQLREVLENISVHLNVDGPEGGMDGLVQVLTCNEKIGWRDQSLRMLLYMSNAEFHLAGDGKVGAVLEPNPGQCLLNAKTDKNGLEFDEYDDDTLYDYPSPYHLKELVRSSQTNVVFAVTSEGLDPLRLKGLYQDLADVIEPFGRVIPLESDSANLISVIQEAFDGISQEVRLFPRESNENLQYSYTPGEGCLKGTDDTVICTNVSIGENVSVTVSVNMIKCLSEPTPVALTSPAFGTINLMIEPLCDCNCSADIEENATECGGRGDLVCGQCQCSPGWAGEMCECEESETIPTTCGNKGLDMLECSGPSRGECDCGTCKCFVQERLLREKNITEPYFGEDCECDHYLSCGGINEDGLLCSGHGDCKCPDECDCAEEPVTGIMYQGDRCECDPLENCYSQEHQGVCVYTGADMSDSSSTNAECDACTGCLCRQGTIAGPDGTCDPICAVNEECARCEKGMESEGTDCSSLEMCNSQLYTDVNEPLGEFEECTFTDEDDCVHTFYVLTDDGPVLVADDRVCPPGPEGIGNLAWIIPVAVILGLLALGGLILLLVFLIKGTEERHLYETVDYSVLPPPSTQPTYEEVDVVREARGSHDIQLTFN
jgi:hypothetical protein